MDDADEVPAAAGHLVLTGVGAVVLVGVLLAVAIARPSEEAPDQGVASAPAGDDAAGASDGAAQGGQDAPAGDGTVRDSPAEGEADPGGAGPDVPGAAATPAASDGTTQAPPAPTTAPYSSQGPEPGQQAPQDAVPVPPLPGGPGPAPLPLLAPTAALATRPRRRAWRLARP